MSNPNQAMQTVGQDFKRTGKNVSVSRDDLINAAKEKLAQFDAMTPDQQKQNPDPYNAPINIIVANGKLVQIPRYIQKAAIDMRRSDQMMSPHTRIARRDRYAGNDPFIMNRDLKNVVGARDDIDAIDYDLVDNDIDVQRDRDIQRRRSVGRVNVPPRLGRGGCGKDLPRDYQLFNKMIDRNVDDMPFITDKNAFESVKPVGFYKIDDGNYFSTQDRYDALAKERVNMGSRRSDRQDMSDIRDRILDNRGGPNEQSRDSDDNISPIESDIGVEENMKESAVVENYAPLDDEPIEYGYLNEDPMEVNVGDDCDTCNSCNNKPMYHGRPLPNDNNEPEYDERYDDRYDERIVDRVANRMNDRHENYDSDRTVENMDVYIYDSIYKYLFFILLIAVLFLFYRYKTNHGTGLDFGL